MKKIIEAALFISGKSMTVEELVPIVDADSAEVEKALEELRQEYNKRDTSLELIVTEDAWKIDVRRDFLDKVKSLAPTLDLGRALLQTLSYIAYKQPITQSHLVKKFGNRIYDYVKELERLGLIRSEPSGRSKGLSTTKKLSDYLGEKDLENIRGAMEQATAERKAKKDALKEKFKVKFTTRKGQKAIKEKEKPDKDITFERFTQKIEKEKKAAFEKQLEKFEKKADKESEEDFVKEYISQKKKKEE